MDEIATELDVLDKYRATGGTGTVPSSTECVRLYDLEHPPLMHGNDKVNVLGTYGTTELVANKDISISRFCFADGSIAQHWNIPKSTRSLTIPAGKLAPIISYVEGVKTSYVPGSWTNGLTVKLNNDNTVTATVDPSLSYYGNYEQNYCQWNNGYTNADDITLSFQLY